MAIPKKFLVLSACFPSRVEPVYGVFVKERVKFVARHTNADVRVVAPMPYFPPLRVFRRWYMLSQIAHDEVLDGMQIVRPRYPMVPRIGGYIHSSLMLPTTYREIRRLRLGFDFELIDSHFIYPSGVTAVNIAKKLDKPVVITCRGEDIEKFPRSPMIAKQVRWALENANQLVAVSDPIAEAMLRLGADPRKVTVITNGVDTERFHRLDQQACRKELNLPLDRPIVLSAGYRIERKGFHLLVEALSEIRKHVPNVLVAIVGGPARWAPDYLPEIQKRIDAQGLHDHVLITGNRPQDELIKWYNAADLFSLNSGAEGSPNVLMEALACGLPAVATRVGGIPDVLKDPRHGILLPSRTVEAIGQHVTTALSQKWDRDVIAGFAQSRSWDVVAQQVAEVFEKAMAGNSSGATSNCCSDVAFSRT